MLFRSVGGCLNFALLFLSIYHKYINLYTLIIYNKDDFEQAKELSKNSDFFKKIEIINGDATNLPEIIGNDYNIVFLIDVLEHIKDDKKVIENIKKIMNLKGYLFISVPTYDYKKYFGEEFHNQIGHIRDGYLEKDLEILCKDFTKIKSFYYTNMYNSLLMSIIYKYLFHNKSISKFIYILTFPWMKYLIYYTETIKTKKNSSLIYICRNEI